MYTAKESVHAKCTRVDVWNAGGRNTKSQNSSACWIQLVSEDGRVLANVDWMLSFRCRIWEEQRFTEGWQVPAVVTLSTQTYTR